MAVRDPKPVAPLTQTQIDAARAALHEHDAAWRAAWAQFCEAFASLQTTARQHGVTLRHGTDELQFDRLGIQLDTFWTGEELDLALGRAVRGRRLRVEAQEQAARYAEQRRQQDDAERARLLASLNAPAERARRREEQVRREALAELGEADAA